MCPQSQQPPAESTGGSSSDKPETSRGTRVSFQPELKPPPEESEDEPGCVTCGATPGVDTPCRSCDRPMCPKCWKSLSAPCMKCRGAERDDQGQKEQASASEYVKARPAWCNCSDKDIVPSEACSRAVFTTRNPAAPTREESAPSKAPPPPMPKRRAPPPPAGLGVTPPPAKDQPLPPPMPTRRPPP